MKKFLIVLLLFITVLACAQEQILYRENFTILFDAPETLPDLLTGESISYRVYLWDMSQGAPVEGLEAAGDVGESLVGKPAGDPGEQASPDPARQRRAVGISVEEARTHHDIGVIERL